MITKISVKIWIFSSFHCIIVINKQNLFSYHIKPIKHIPPSKFTTSIRDRNNKMHFGLINKAINTKQDITNSLDSTALAKPRAIVGVADQ